MPATPGTDTTRLSALESELDAAFENELQLSAIPKGVAREALLDVTELLLTGQGKQIDEESGAMSSYFNNLTKSASSALRQIEPSPSTRHDSLTLSGMPLSADASQPAPSSPSWKMRSSPVGRAILRLGSVAQTWSSNLLVLSWTRDCASFELTMAMTKTRTVSSISIF